MKNEFGWGVIYKDEDYAGIFRRLVILLLDFSVIVSLMYGGILFDEWNFDNSATYDNYYFYYLMIVVAFLYLTVIKTSKFGTLGQLVTKTRVETIYGSKPNFFRMTLRLLFWFFGPLNLITDILFMGMIKEKRSVRDCICNTIVVRKKAVPIEKDKPIHVARVFALGMNLMYESCNDGNA